MISSTVPISSQIKLAAQTLAFQHGPKQRGKACMELSPLGSTYLFMPLKVQGSMLPKAAENEGSRVAT